jgi:cytochrome c-type protein NapB
MIPARLLASLAAATLLAVPAPVLAADPPPVQLQSLRGTTPIDQTVEPEVIRMQRDQPPIARSSRVEPPLIPHSIRGYQITKNFNKCMDCHAWSKAKDTGATKVSQTHFKDASGRELSNITPARYVCTTCHVSQTDAKPLVANTFQPAPELAPKKQP